MQFENASLYRQILSRSVPFKGLDDEVLDSILKQGMVLNAEADELVFYEHMRGGLGLYVILEGQIEIFHSRPTDKDPEGTGQHLTTLGPGECLGEYSLIDGKNTSAAAKALEPSKLFLLSRGAFERIVDSDAEAGRKIYHSLLLFLIERLRKHP